MRVAIVRSMSEPITVDVFADPGLPTRTVTRALEMAGENGDDRYQFTHHTTRIPLRPDGTLDMDAVRQWSRDDEVDLLIVITEIPRRAGRLVKIAGLHIQEGAAIISLPALGLLGLVTKLRRAMFDSLDALAAQRMPSSGDRRIRFGVVHEQQSSTGPSVFISPPRWWPGRARLVLGMVRTNEPLSVIPKLSGVLAAAAATGAFGIFYSSIWQMANALPDWRLGLITVMVVLTMVTWLIASNRLWQRSRTLNSLTEATMYNASTVATLVMAVALLYAALFVGILLTGLVVIESGFMAETIGAEVSLRNYVDIAWLSASLGTVAGALGSNFDDPQDIRSLTHGRRHALRFPSE